MEKGKIGDIMGAVKSDLNLISRIQDDNDQDSLLEIIDRHSGIFHSMVNYFMSHPQNDIDKNQIVG